MADDASGAQPSADQVTVQTASGGSLTVPAALQTQHADLLDLIARSESMNDEERQYWVNILPIMTPEQIQNLRDILTNERKQLAAIDAKYAGNAQAVAQQRDLKDVEEERRQRSEKRTTAEASTKSVEEQEEDDLLKKIQGV